jgi:hypothetical protein
MTQDLVDAFRDMALVEQEIRNDIARYGRERITPRQFAPRVRRHPVMAITSPLKMQHAAAVNIGYDNSEPQTTFFAHRDSTTIRKNHDAARALVADLLADGVNPTRSNLSYVVFKGGSSQHILRFLDRYVAHERCTVFRPDKMAEYIRGRNSVNKLSSWNVAIVTRQSRGSAGEFDFGNRVAVPLLNRARLRTASGIDFAGMGAMLSARDRIADIDASPNVVSSLKNVKDFQALRDDKQRGTGLLLLYPIDRASAPLDPKLRDPLDAVEHLIGAVAIFPDLGDAATVYMSVVLPPLQLGMDDDADVDVIPDDDGND